MCASLSAMSRAERTVNLIGVIVPFLGLIAAIVLLWNQAVDWIDIGIMVVTYVLFGLGVTVGFHRLLTHRSFRTHKATEYTFAVLGSMALQGSVMDWVADHRKHHAHADEEGDPHSPHVGHGSGLKGLWHAHTGWLLETQGQADWKRYARELYEDRGMRALLWGGLVRIFLVHHVTWSINSICHFYGRRRFALDDESTNVAWLAIPSLGESWHHNHHAFPRSASHGLRRWERALDPSALVIKGLEKVGLARNVVTIAPDRQRQRERTAAPMRAASRV